jgi:hypothetical protein
MCCWHAQLVNKKSHRDGSRRHSSVSPSGAPRPPPLPLPPVTPTEVSHLVKATKDVFKRFSERDYAIAMGVCEALSYVASLSSFVGARLRAPSQRLSSLH